MQAEITLTHYWRTFKEQCLVRKVAANNKIDTAVAKLKKLKDNVFYNSEELEKWLNVELDLHFDPKSSYDYKALGELARQTYRDTPFKFEGKREALIELVSLCLELLRIRKYADVLERIEWESKIPYREYVTYVKRFYMQVQREIIAGRAYSYGEYMGRIYVSRGSNPTGKNFKGKIDYTATRNKKAELIAKGLRPYDKLEHEYAIANKQEYDGVDYRVYLNNPYYYDLSWGRCMFPKKSVMKLKRLKFTGKIIRKNNATMEDVIRELTVEEIEVSDLDLMYKVNAITAKEPHLGYRYIRNDEQEIYNYRKGIRKAR